MSYQEPYDEDEVRAEEVELPTVYTGDEFADEELDYSPDSQNANFTQQEVQIPDVVRNFIIHFHRNVTERNTWDLHAIYENGWNKLTEKFFPKSHWPEPDAVATLVDEDPVFLILYRELYYRHIYSKLTPTIEDRIGSYSNYCDLFNYILNSSAEPSDLELPNQWLWDIIDEFIYQFQAFCIYRSKVQSKSEVEIELLKERPDVWNVHNVLNVLYSLIQKSRINEQLLVSKNGGDMMEAAGEFGSRPLYRLLGYFSIIGLLRVHCLLGDYVLALKTMENVELNKKGLFARVTACHVTTYYYVGFAYMMMRRYSDAIKAFAHILLFVSRTKQYHTRSYQFDAISKKSEQMYALLAMSVALSPQRVDENVHTAMREKYGEQSIKMQKGEEGLPIFEELFNFACPKFISPVPPDYDVATNSNAEPQRHQLRVFIAEVRTQLMVPTIRSFLKLYTTLGVEKLAAFLDLPVDDVRTQLLVFKHKTRQRRYESGSVLEGEFGPTTDLDFYLKQDLIYIAESKPGRRVGDWFIRNINKYEDIASNMERR
ncbi:RNA polymerase I-associated factor PAF67-domain-containing protein [Fimicolochytrium jonesii]|uniref:RNA polymerase I-associated factor PAF67-domain-containing protein n=1 Tax=Fimicolochytrium jonesii TaxID=1396493 RepID=UPI0022FDE1B1|nr:RNA polymerase I-associated factor PAF67-domain-containing protein [Fimicolochytrium jonesii]KAI8817716.1 RNA polymerase I-associated factor PAF67-domain-containing protein [Fimicolochytrium jonesii]